MLINTWLNERTPQFRIYKCRVVLLFISCELLHTIKNLCYDGTATSALRVPHKWRKQPQMRKRIVSVIRHRLKIFSSCVFFFFFSRFHRCQWKWVRRRPSTATATTPSTPDEWKKAEANGRTSEPVHKWNALVSSRVLLNAFKWFWPFVNRQSRKMILAICVHDNKKGTFNLYSAA